MTEALDMSLDDIIKKNKKSVAPKPSSAAAAAATNSRPRGRGHGRGLESGPPGGPTRRIDTRFPARPNPYFVPQAYHVQEMLVGGKAANSEAGTKLYISNLHYEVTNEDIKVLFSDVGELKRYSIHYDRSGRSKGTAEVVYMRQTDAVAAMKRYNNVQLDGKPMLLELVGVNIVTPVPIPPMQTGILGNNPTNAPRSIQDRIVGRGKERGGNNGNHGSGRGRIRPEKVSAKDLDADLESFQGRRIVGRGQERGGNKGNQGSGKGRSRPQKVSAKDLDADLERYRLQAMHMK